jgi:hypothetical protein
MRLGYRNRLREETMSDRAHMGSAFPETNAVRDW